MLADHFLDAERTGRAGHGLRRIEWLESWPELETPARPVRVVAEPGYERWDGNGALGYLVLNAIVEAQLADAARARAGRRRRPDVPDRDARPLGAAARRGRARRGADRDLAAAARPPRRAAPKLTGTNPLAIAIPSTDGPPVVADVSMGNLTYGDVLAGRATEDELAPVRRRRRRTRPSRSRSGCSCSSTRSRPDDGFGAVLLVARPLEPTRCRPSARSRRVCAFRAIADRVVRRVPSRPLRLIPDARAAPGGRVV